jgi:hypothetical protein
MAGWTLSLVALAGLAGLSGCAGTPASDPFDAGFGEPRPVRVEVVNNNFNDATIWAVYPADRVRLGTVSGKSQSNFNLRTRTAEPVYMEIDMVGGSRCITDQLTVDEGDVLRLEIPVEMRTMTGCR